MHLVLGLGNPGRRYNRTRHNAGFLVVDRLADRQGLVVERKHLGALVESTRLGDHPVVLAKPQAFMNLSGQPAASLRGYYKVADTDIVVVHDNVDIPFGDVRVKKGGGHGGHNGLRDLIAKLGTQVFVRVRFGVGKASDARETADHVLAPFSDVETAALPELLDRAADAVSVVVHEGPDRAMNVVNTRTPPRPPTPAQS